MSDNLVGKLVKELQKLALPTASEPPPARLSRADNLDRWASRMEDYLRGIDASAHGSAILARLDDDVKDLARAAGVSSSMPSTEILKYLRGLLCGTTPSWLRRSEFRRPAQEALEGVLESHQAFRLRGRRAYPTMQAADLKQMLLDLKGRTHRTFPYLYARHLVAIWPLTKKFRGRFQQPGEGVLDYQQALHLLGRRTFPTMDAAALTQRVLEQFIAGVRDPEVWKALMRGQPATLDKALDLARQEEALQAV
ncbi:hypothetical protein SprV_0301342300 [Sparganum proliferum]